MASSIPAKRLRSVLDAQATIVRVLPGLDVAAVRHYCEQHVLPHALHQVRTELVLTRGAVTIVERRAP